MNMTFRWFGPDEDPISLRHIRQIPGIRGIVGSVWDVPVGEAWPVASIERLERTVADSGLELKVIESVNIHEDIKLGLPSRDQYIDNYLTTLRRLAKVGITTVCYNFMPVFDWFRTDLARELPDGSNALYYDKAIADALTPAKAMQAIMTGSQGFTLPGWEPQRLARLEELFQSYQGVTKDDLLRNLQYFLQAIVPVCSELGIRMAIHPDDPPAPLFGLPRIVTSADDVRRILALVDDPANSLTLCSGSLGANPANDVPAMVREFGSRGRIAFAHLRNVRFTGGGSFTESSHLSREGSLDMYAIVQALHQTGYDGPIRPDHGRMIWDEKGRPGYGLYDRALGIAYLNGLFEAVSKGSGVAS